jgi:hypothetical protein
MADVNLPQGSEATGGADYGNSGWYYPAGKGPGRPGLPYTIIKETGKNGDKYKLVLVDQCSTVSGITTANAQAVGPPRTDVTGEPIQTAGGAARARNVFSGIKWKFHGKDKDGSDKEFDCDLPLREIDQPNPFPSMFGILGTDQTGERLGVTTNKADGLCQIFEKPAKKD